MTVNTGGEFSFSFLGEAGTNVARLQLMLFLSLSHAPPNEEADMEEEHAEKDYAAVLAESSATRAGKEELASALARAAETAKVISSLHKICHWFLQHFDVRKTARVGLVEALDVVLALAQITWLGRGILTRVLRDTHRNQHIPDLSSSNQRRESR